MRGHDDPHESLGSQGPAPAHSPRGDVADALAAERERLRITLSSIGDAVVSTDAEGRVDFLNPVAEALTGWPLKDAVGRPLGDIFRIVNEHTRQPVENPALRALRERSVVGLANHTVLISRDGTERPIDDSAAPMTDPSGHVVGSVLVFRDVTDQKRAELERARLAAIVETSDDAIVSKTLDGVIRTWNAAAERLFGYTAKEAVGQHITLIIPDDRLDEEPRIIERLKKGERVDHFETVRVAKDGRLLEISLTISPLLNAEGHVIGASKIAREIGQRKQIEAALKASEARYRAIVEATPECVKLVARDGTLLQMNSAGFGMIEGDESALGQCVYNVIAPEHRETFRAFNERVCGGEGGTLSFDIIGLKGTRRHMETTAVPLAAPTGGYTQLAVTRDVTDRRRAEATVREREERLKLFLENATDYAVIISDTEDRVTDWLGGAEKITGWTKDEVLGEPVSCIFTPEDRAAGIPERETSKAAETGRGENVRWHVRKDGTRFFGEGVTVGLRGPAGELRGYGKVFRDATEQKRAEELLARDALILAGVRDSVVVTDLEGVVTYWNDGATRLYGWTAEETVGRHYADRYPEPERTWIADQIRERAAGVEWAGEYEDRKKDGTKIWIDARVSPVKDVGGQVVAVLGVAHDITVRKAAEDSIKEADRKKDEFIALLAHELRNPLAPIRNGLQVLKLADDRAVRQKAQEMMDRQLTHMVRLVDDLLDVSRITRNKLELRKNPVRVADVINTAVETARPLIDAADHTLEVAVPPEPIVVDGDLTRLAQVFGNLLTNAAKYTPPGGRIRVAAVRRGGAVAVTVQDTGIGIPAESLPRIFDMFSQVERTIERETGGLGIGLNLVKGLVEMHGGTVTAESDGPGKGSTFCVWLPTTDSAEEDGGDSAGGTGVTKSGRRILVVDDNRDSAGSMAMMLELLGDSVRVAHDGLEAVEAAEEFRPEVILMDVGMPKLNGYEATRQIRAKPWGRAITVIALTGWGQPGDRELSKEAGCDGHLVKPVSLPDLERLLTDLKARATEHGS